MKTVKEVSIILGISMAAAFTVNYFSPAGIALVGQFEEKITAFLERYPPEVVIGRTWNFTE